MAETMFVREKKENNYTVLDNTFIRDNELSWKAKGLMTYLLSLPADWEIYLTELENHASDGRDSLKSAIKELEEKGYIEKLQKKEKGKFAGYQYIIHEIPVNRSGKTVAEKPFTEKPFTENPQLLNTNNTKYLNIQNTDNTNICTEKTDEKKETQKNFKKPTVEEISEYILQNNYAINAEQFYDFYESKGWLVGKTKMKDWKACVRTWQRNSNKQQNNYYASKNIGKPECDRFTSEKIQCEF